jgi:hypothetical protein
VTGGTAAPLSRYVMAVLGSPTQRRQQVLGWRLSWPSPGPGRDRRAGRLSRHRLT